MSDSKPPLSEEQVSALLKQSQAPAAPEASDTLAAVRARIAAGEAAAQAPMDDAAPPPAPVSLAAEREKRGRWKAWSAEVAVVAAAAVAVVIGVTVAGDMKTSGAGTQAAGVSGEADAKLVELKAPVDAATVRELAAAAGLLEMPASDEGAVVVEGDFRQAKRFLVALRVAAAKQGGEVHGFVPDAARLRFLVTPPS